MPKANDSRIVRAAASRRMRSPAPYDGPLFVLRCSFEVKADNRTEAVERMETLIAEIITGADIDATDLWVRSAYLLLEEGVQCLKPEKCS